MTMGQSRANESYVNNPPNYRSSRPAASEHRHRQNFSVHLHINFYFYYYHLLLYLSVYLPTHPPTYLSTCLPTHPPTHPPTYLPTYLPTHPPTYLSIVILLDLGCFFCFLIVYTVGRTPWTGISQSQDRYLHKEHKHRINAQRHPYLQWDSNPGSQCSSERRQFMHLTARPP
jgi:hypothetical protein